MSSRQKMSGGILAHGKKFPLSSSKSLSSPSKARQKRRSRRSVDSEQRKKRKAERRAEVNLALLDSLLSADLGVSLDMPLTSDMSLETVECVLMRRSFLKKFEAAQTAQADHLSISKFLERNEACRTWLYEPASLFDDVIDGELKSILYQSIYPSFDSTFGLAEISSGFNVGPGANLDCELTDFLTKVFHSSLTCTHQDLHTFYVSALSDHAWGKAEKKRYLEHGLRVVHGSRLSTVPKTVDETRVICTEPVLNMLFQKGIGAALENRLVSAFGIDIRRTSAKTQPEINRLLAQEGSISGKFATIDLTGASDSISTRLCEQILPSRLHWWLCFTRSPFTVLPDGERVKLEMISSMGNAFTFPLQTLIFASIVKACYRVLGLPTPRCDSEQPTFGVFGDDIVCLGEAYEVVTRALNRYGFRVNENKSFNNGYFRESCGGDYWRGQLVRGVYVKKLSSEADVYSALNRIVRWCVRSGKNLELTLWYLRGRLRRKLLTIPFQEGDTGGLKVPERLHTLEAMDHYTRSAFYKTLVPRTRSYAVPYQDGPWKAFREGEIRCYNDNAILVALCGGFVRDGRMGLRNEDPTSFIVRWHSCPSWDYVSMASSSEMRGKDWKVHSAQLLTELVGS